MDMQKLKELTSLGLNVTMSFDADEKFQVLVLDPNAKSVPIYKGADLALALTRAIIFTEIGPVALDMAKAPLAKSIASSIEKERLEEKPNLGIAFTINSVAKEAATRTFDIAFEYGQLRGLVFAAEKLALGSPDSAQEEILLLAKQIAARVSQEQKKLLHKQE